MVVVVLLLDMLELQAKETLAVLAILVAFMVAVEVAVQVPLALTEIAVLVALVGLVQLHQ